MTQIQTLEPQIQASKSETGAKLYELGGRQRGSLMEVCPFVYDIYLYRATARKATEKDRRNTDVIHLIPRLRNETGGFEFFK